MKKLIGVIMCAIFALNLVSAKDAEIAEKYKWDMTPIYASDDAWETAKNNLISNLDDVSKYRGKLASSPQVLYECLKLNSDVGKTFGRLYSYANMKSDQDTRVSKYQAMKQEIAQIGTQFSSKASFIEPEILKMSKDEIKKFLGEESKLKPFEFYLNDLIRQKEHYLSAPEEKIIAEAGLISGAAGSIYSIFSNADFPYPTVKLSDGKEAYLDAAGYSKYRALSDREDRKLVFETFFNELNKYNRTFGTQLASNVKKDLFYANVRNYNSCLESALDENNIPTDVYHKLIENVNDNLDTFHRYLSLKAKMMGVDKLGYYDLYASVVKDLDMKFSYDEAQELVLDAVKPLGKKYKKVVKQAFDERWIDVYPVKGKRSGAYSNGSIYDVHPYILLNYNGQYNDVSTLIHELGHTMHSYYSNHNQPFETADYSIFVAEVASTFNEVLLFHDYYKSLKKDNEKLSLLMNYLDGIKGTVFRQTQFAEFELRIHEMVEKGEQLTGESLNKLYKEIVDRYYGHNEGFCEVPEYIQTEWAYIPHFYYNFYVYQYSTSYTASVALAKKVMSGDKEALKKYIKFISSGGSDYPINILKNAGVDMTGSEPFELTMKEMNWAMDEIEKLLK
jgi:oligoendopeptidase F